MNSWGVSGKAGRFCERKAKASRRFLVEAAGVRENGLVAIGVCGADRSEREDVTKLRADGRRLTGPAAVLRIIAKEPRMAIEANHRIEAEGWFPGSCREPRDACINHLLLADRAISSPRKDKASFTVMVSNWAYMHLAV